MSLRTQTARKFDLWKQYGVCCSSNLASRHTKVFHGNWAHDYESTAATKRHGFLVRFFRPLCSKTGRIRRNFNCSNYEKFEESYAQLLGILNELRWHGEVGRPRFLVSFQLFSGRHVVLPGTPEHGTPEHRNITEHSGTPPKNPEHPKKTRNTPRKPGTPPRKPGTPQENQKHPKKTRNTPRKTGNRFIAVVSGR